MIVFLTMFYLLIPCFVYNTVYTHLLNGEYNTINLQKIYFDYSLYLLFIKYFLKNI
jgi:hypothetical protein